MKKRLLDAVLLATSLFLVPFLWVLSVLIGGGWFMPVALPSALLGLALLWLCRGVFALKTSRWNRAAICLLLLCGADFALSWMLGRNLGSGGITVWDWLSAAVVLVVALVLFLVGHTRKKT